MAYEIAARESRGELLPGSGAEDDTRYKPGKVLLMASEDDPEDALRPRLEDLGADLERVTLLSGLQNDKGEVTGVSFRDVQASPRE